MPEIIFAALDTIYVLFGTTEPIIVSTFDFMLFSIWSKLTIEDAISYSLLLSFVEIFATDSNSLLQNKPISIFVLPISMVTVSYTHLTLPTILLV